MNGIIITVLSSFVLAFAAPWLARCTRSKTGLILALFPLALFVWFAVLLKNFSDPLTGGLTWSHELGLRFSFYIDGLGLLFALLITGVGTLVFIYSSGYIGAHPHAGRFYAYLLTFMGSMLGIVLADDLVLLFVFWELTSITSWLLIGFEHKGDEARHAAWQALLVTSAGGLAFLAAAILLHNVVGTFALSELLGRGDVIRAHGSYQAILLLVLFGAFTKSAQFPFHFWLPNAMTAPTPVSAYLHSATMVKAGVFLLARLSPVLGGTHAWEYLVTGFGALTMLTGGFLALFSTNLKRVLAYLTVSALGMMTLLLGLGSAEAVEASLVFLLAHALYKGALFMVAGSVDHATGTRDLAHLGGLRHLMPLSFAAAILAALSLAAFGPLLSFIGKEMMLRAALHWKPAPGLLTAAITVAASLFVVAAGICAVRPFFGPLRTPAEHETSASMWAPPLVLGLLGIVFAAWPAWFGKVIVEPSTTAVLTRHASVHLKLWHGVNLPFLLSLGAVVSGLLLYLLWRAFIPVFSRLGRALAFGPEAWYEVLLAALSRIASAQTRFLQNGYLRLYILTILLAATALSAGVLLAREPLRWPSGSIGLRFWEITVAALIVAALLAMIYLQARLAVIAALSVVGYGVALLFILFSAPDLAMTQFLVETLVLVLLVMAFFRLPHFKNISQSAVRWRDLLLSLAFGALITCLVLGANVAGSPSEVGEFYASHSVPEAKGHNIVNVILVDFRALDTMGEITVLVTAAVGVLALLQLAKKDKSG